MSLGENIHTAFEIVAKTYENVSKLISFCQDEASEESDFILSSPKFLRWKSDNDLGGWLMKSFIQLFQSSEDKLLDNQWREGPIYVMEINLNPYTYSEPMVNLAKFLYVDISSWNEGVSPASHWIFHDPLYDGKVEYDGDDFEYTGTISDEAYSSRHWGLYRVVGVGMPLVEITRENVREKIFDGFRLLIEK